MSRSVSKKTVEDGKLQSPTRTEDSKYSDSLGGIQGSLNVFKQSLNQSATSGNSDRIN